MVTFNVLIATIGRPSLQRMLDSLLPQLTEQDCLTIVFDGNSELPYFDFTHAKCKVNQYCEPVALGYWGHAIRNKYASLLEKRDFVLHADDDDTYFPQVFDKLRQRCLRNMLYIARMKLPDGRIIPQYSKGFIIPKSVIKLQNIGTPCGIIPYELNIKGHWKHCSGGDWLFYESIKKLTNITYLDLLLYNVRN